MWKTRRRVAALAQAIVFLSLPFLSICGESAIRFDIPDLALHFFGSVLRIDQFHLVLLGVIFVLLFAASGTILFGRIWCGWICPQTTIPELSAWGASFLPARRKSAGKIFLLLPLSALVSLSLLWYFLPPAEAVTALFRSKIVLAFFLVQWLVIFSMLAGAGADFCRTICPYSMLQNVLFDRDTLTIAFDKVREKECMRCDLCVIACPVAIDIKKGLARECIACAECIDACHLMTEPRGIPPFISYRGRVVRRKALLFSLLSTAAGFAFLAVWALRPPVAFTVQWAGKTRDPSADFYRYSVRDNRGKPLERSVGGKEGDVMTGETNILLGPYSRESGEVVVRKNGESENPATFGVSGPGISFQKGAGFP